MIRYWFSASLADLSCAFMVQLRASLDCLTHRAGEGELAAPIVTVSGTPPRCGLEESELSAFRPTETVRIAHARSAKSVDRYPAKSITAMGQKSGSCLQD